MRGVSVWTYYQENMAGVEEAPERDLVTVVVDILLSLREQTNDANNNYKVVLTVAKKVMKDILSFAIGYYLCF